jgi:hypothetical protein
MHLFDIKKLIWVKLQFFLKLAMKLQVFVLWPKSLRVSWLINGKFKSTYQNYLRQIAKLSVYYGSLPLELDVDQVEEYLYYLIQKDTDSISSFKHLVYGLRKLYLLFDREELELALPCISRPEKLPVVLSTQEVKSLPEAPKHLSQRAPPDNRALNEMPNKFRFSSETIPLSKHITLWSFPKMLSIFSISPCVVFVSAILPWSTSQYIG